MIGRAVGDLTVFRARLVMVERGYLDVYLLRSIKDGTFIILEEVALTASWIHRTP